MTERIEGRDRLARSFATGAHRYARLRPGYPEEAARFCAGADRVTVVDVGAGSGKFTGVLAALGHDVVAVEPSAGMREQLARIVPGVRVHAGSAEATGLGEASVDVATFAQSWHWVDPPAASAELARILRPGGAVAMVWNVFDDSVPWLDRYEDAMHSSPLAWARGRDAEDQAAGVAPVGRFGPGARHTVRWTDRMAKRDLLELVTTRSYYLAAPADQQAALVAAVRRSLDRDHPGVGDDEILDVAYRTVCVRYPLREARHGAPVPTDLPSVTGLSGPSEA